MPQVTNSSSFAHDAAFTLLLSMLLVIIILFAYQSCMARELSSSYPTLRRYKPSGENFNNTIALKWNSLKWANTSLVSISQTNISIHLALPAYAI